MRRTAGRSSAWSGSLCIRYFNSISSCICAPSTDPRPLHSTPPNQTIFWWGIISCFNVKMTSNNMATSKSLDLLPAEIVVPIITKLSSKDAIAFARTSHEAYNKTIQTIWRQAVETSSTFIVHWAAHHGRLDTLKLALSYGADVNQPCCYSEPILAKQHANYKPEYGVAELSRSELDLLVKAKARGQRLRERSAHTFTQWFKPGTNTFERCGMNELDDFFNYYSHVDELSMDHTDKTWITEAESLETKMMLLSVFRYWVTPLHIAAHHGHAAIVKELLDKGADVNATSVGLCSCSDFDVEPDRAYSPLHQLLCANSDSQSYPIIMEQLVKSGACSLEFFMAEGGVRSVRNCNIDTSYNELFFEAVTKDYATTGLLESLLRNGCRKCVYERNPAGRSVLNHVIEQDMGDEVVKSLLHGETQFNEVVRIYGLTDYPEDSCSILTVCSSHA